jgi:hypothetical protein
VALEDFGEGEVGLAVLGTAAALSPRVRQVVRRGAVFAVGGALKVGDVVAGAAKGAVQGARDGGSGAGRTRRAPARRRSG